MSPVEFALYMGGGLLGMFATLALIAMLAAPLVNRHAREHRERIHRIAQMKAQEREQLLTCLPDPRPVAPAFDTGLAGELERFLARNRSRR